MRTIRLPRLVFSSWYSWERRAEYPRCKYPGVYLLSITEKKDLDGQHPSWHDVSYIGMTNAQGGLISRWGQFDRTINGGEGHSGGRTVFQDLGPYSGWSKSLYVAAMGVECDPRAPTTDDYIRMGWVAFFEYEAFARFHEEAGGHPPYNKQ